MNKLSVLIESKTKKLSTNEEILISSKIQGRKVERGMRIKKSFFILK
jgi:hypothetical protein